jgi:hypothetical protein
MIVIRMAYAGDENGLEVSDGDVSVLEEERMGIRMAYG